LISRDAIIVIPDPPKPYDFLVNGEFLRSSLKKYIETHGVSEVSFCQVFAAAAVDDAVNADPDHVP